MNQSDVMARIAEHQVNGYTAKIHPCATSVIVEGPYKQLHPMGMATFNKIQLQVNSVLEAIK